MLQYVPQFREKTFVVAVDGAAVADENFVNILMDVAVLWSLSIRTVLVHGASDQIKALADQRGVEPSDLEGSGVTDAATLKLALTAANRLTHEILEGLSAADLRAASTNAVIAHPLGILKGVDHLFTGKVERIDVGLLQTLLSSGIVPVVPPLGVDGEGHTYRLNSDAVAVELAKALGAVKLVYITTTDGLSVGGSLARQLSAAELADALQKGTVDPAQVSKARHAVAACEAGIPRVHVINGRVDEGLLSEVFSNEGIGTLVYVNEYQQIRRARRSDVRAIDQLIRSSIEKDELAPRTRASIEKELGDYFIFEVDKNPIACVALHAYPEESKGELACLYVAALAREPGHRPDDGAVRRVEGPRAGARPPARALDPGLQLLPVEGRLRRGDARRPAARAPREVRRERPPLEGAGQEALEPDGLTPVVTLSARPSHGA